ncbi:hypothetical protein A2989_04130 [Candidatus Amesbacteria bacterium RIFCSPLOWO2_01_FULL_48_25]|uniref:Fibronectin type-III domain-containing protein n=1 Tax=Candidatus Amesbacteria bacterium RIFCSPLOWO2_01_FULL_48_25 TaxID=1797259 RepID=A0A1F4ZBS9_9BACT|nr:MAG: hypothetical protein A2989_04130 [Candidatus Amesbacteria bacterium RIFCSPLOWO2_01_FULL_48_25]
MGGRTSGCGTVYTPAQTFICANPSPCGLLNDSQSGYELGEGMGVWKGGGAGTIGDGRSVIQVNSGYGADRIVLNGEITNSTVYTNVYQAPASNQQVRFTGYYYVQQDLDPALVSMSAYVNFWDAANNQVPGAWRSVALDKSVGGWKPQFTVDAPYISGVARVEVGINMIGAAGAGLGVYIDNLCMNFITPTPVPTSTPIPTPTPFINIYSRNPGGTLVNVWGMAPSYNCAIWPVCFSTISTNTSTVTGYAPGGNLDKGGGIALYSNQILLGITPVPAGGYFTQRTNVLAGQPQPSYNWPWQNYWWSGFTTGGRSLTFIVTTPTPIPTLTPCQVTTSPAVLNLTVGGSTGTVSAIVSSGLGSATINSMAFGSYNNSLALVSPTSDTTSPHQTSVTAVAAGSTAVWGTATLSDGRTCQSTGTTDTDVVVSNPTPTTAPTPTTIITPTSLPTPTSAPTPLPTPYCNIDVSPLSCTLSVPQTCGITANVSLFNGATPSQVRFGSYNTSIAVVTPAADPSSPYQTTATAVSPGNTAVWATTDLVGGQTCSVTGATDTDIFVSTPTPIPPTPTTVPTCNTTLQPNPLNITLNSSAVVTGYPVPTAGLVNYVAFYSANSSIAAVATPTGDPTSPYSRAILGRNIGTTNLYAQCYMGTTPYPTSLPVTVNVACPSLVTPVISSIAAPACGVTSATVNWNVISGANQYEIQRYSLATGLWSGSTPILTPTPRWTDTSVACNLGYQYRVRAITAGGATSCLSPWSAASNQITGKCVPTAPSGMTFTDNFDGSANISWLDDPDPTPGSGVPAWFPNETAYNISRSPLAFPSPTPGTVVLPAESTSFTDYSCGQTLTYSVTRGNECGLSPAGSVSGVCQTTFFQTQGGDMMCLNGAVGASLPLTVPATYLSLPGVGPTPGAGDTYTLDGVLICQNSNIENGTWSNTNWTAIGTVTYPGYASSTLTSVYSYASIKSRILDVATPQNYPGGSLNAAFDLGSTQKIDGVAYFNGGAGPALTIPTSSVTASQKIVVVSDFPVTITGSITVEPGGLVVIISQGNIDVASGVGVAASDPRARTPDLSGLFVAGGQFRTGVGANTLHIKGVVVGLGGVLLERDVFSNQYPAEFFAYDPEQVYRLPILLRRKNLIEQPLIP